MSESPRPWALRVGAHCGWFWCALLAGGLSLAVSPAWAAAGPAAAADGGPLEQAITKADLDLPNCKVLRAGVSSDAAPEDVLASLGLGPNKGNFWSAGEARGKDGADKTQFQYLLAFRQPMAIGSILCGMGRGGGAKVRVLKPGAPYPPDPAKDDPWLDVAVPPGQSRIGLAALPPGAKTQAVLFTEELPYGKSVLSPCRLFKRRLHNMVPDAAAQAEAEYTAYYSGGGPPRQFLAANIVKGTDSWQNAGPDSERHIVRRAPISDVTPSWFCLWWPGPVEIVGLFSQDNFQEFKLQSYAGPAGISPAAGVESEWLNTKVAGERPGKDAAERGGNGRWITLPPQPVRGLRLFITKCGKDEGVASIECLLAFADLGEGPAPAAGSAENAAPPCHIPYTLEQDGEVTLAVDDANGIRVRNIIARMDRSKGPNAEGWDLMDEGGQCVLPGTYHWKAITHPPLELRYEMTPYPNVVDNAPQNSPWLNGRSGPGGWLADHTAGYGVCTLGEGLYLGAPCPESGVGFIACDLTGAKKWGIHSFAAWSGAKNLAADGNTVFVENGNTIGSDNMDRVWGVDLATQAYRDVVMHRGDENRSAGATAIAAGGGKLYVAVNAAGNYLGNATGAATVDIDNCIPRYKHMKTGGMKDEPDPRGDFLRLFRLTGVPPGYNGLTYLEAIPGPSRKQHVVLCFTSPVSLGSLAFPLAADSEFLVRFSLLKADAAYPPDADDEKSWAMLPEHGRPGWNVIPVPEKTSARALRITFIHGSDDAAADLLDKPQDDGELKLDSAKGKAKAGDKETSMQAANAWTGRLEGLKLLRRRFVNLAGTCKVRVSSGLVAPDGTWDAHRTEPLSEADPGVYLMEWAQPVTARGLAIEEIDGQQTEIDVFTGPGDAQVDLAGSDHWEHVATYVQPLRNLHTGMSRCNHNARYLDGYVDFGRDIQTRAIRMRVVQQWTTRGYDSWGVRLDRGGDALQPSRCRIYGVAPVQYVGGEAPVDPLTDQRIEVYDSAAGKLLKEIPIDKPRAVALGPGGDLFALSDRKLVKVDLDKGAHQVLAADLDKPACLAVDAKGNLYVYDGGPQRHVIRVYDLAGKYQRDIGTPVGPGPQQALRPDATTPGKDYDPTGYVAGTWDGKRFRNVTSLAVDKLDHLWAVDCTYWPKRLTQWTTGGELLKEFFGNTQYGGGGVLDPWDKSRLFFGPSEFELNWQSGRTRMKNLTWAGDGDLAGELPIRIGERTYLVSRPQEMFIQTGYVYLYENGRARLVAVVGGANGFAPLRTPEIQASLPAGKTLADMQFMWSDLNGDGQVQLSEVKFFDAKNPKGWQLTGFGRDLGVQSGQSRYEVKEFLPSGTPVYELKTYDRLPVDRGDSIYYRLLNGNFYHMGDLPSMHDGVFTPRGQMLWSYPVGRTGVTGINSAKPWTPDQVCCQFKMVGDEVAHAGDLGEFFVTNTNFGDWNIWTADGLLAGTIFRDLRDPRCRSWSMPEHERGSVLADITAGQEHFNGYFCRSFQDNKYYVVAGHNHASVLEVVGIDKFKRLGGEVKVGPEMLRAAEAYHHQQALRQAQADVKVIDCYRAGRDIKIDGDLEDWDQVPRTPLMTGDQQTLQGVTRSASFAMAYDDKYLYVSYLVMGMGPMKNSGNEWDKLFKSGAAVDLQIGGDPNADPARKDPVAGDARLLLTFLRDKLTAVIYRPIAPGAAAAKAWEVTSPVARLKFDEVAQLDDVKMACAPTYKGDGYVFEAAIPLKTLGLGIVPGMRAKIDWGMLTTDTGSDVLSRTYWANKATGVLADAPTEAALHPDLWGYVRFFGPSPNAFNIRDPAKILNTDKKTGDDGIKLDE